MEDSRVLQYNGIAFSCIHKESAKEVFSLKEHSLIYLSGGVLDISGPEGTERLCPGESVFVRKDRSLTLAKSMGADGSPFKMVTMTFGRPFLLKYYRQIRSEGVSAVRSGSPLLKIPSRPDVSSLFNSLMPFFWSEEKPDSEWVEQKRIEGLKCILKTDQNVYASLFDFAGEWKIDLAEFMESSFTSDLSLADCANYTGRSLSTFNRDFRKIYGMSPEKWITGKRLERARELLLGGDRSVSSAASEAGFANLSHFSRVYKEAFGVPPSVTSGGVRKKISVASDSFKGCLSSAEVALAAEEGLRAAGFSGEVERLSVADGGEGTCLALADSLGGKLIKVHVRGPLDTPVEAEYCLAGRRAVIEMASAAGLTLIPEKERNPLKTSTFGVGQLIIDALNRGAREFLVGVGGSATNDGGIGMLSALGIRFRDSGGRFLKGIGENLEKIESIDMSCLDPRLLDAKFTVACDVDTPFCGPIGAAFVFAPQKGADEEGVRRLDKGMQHFARIVRRQFGVDLAAMKGSGAAGGLGGAFAAFLRACLAPGIELVLEALDFDEKLSSADLVITGEGRMDAQTPRGKTAAGVLKRAKLAGVPVVALCGSVSRCPELDALCFARIIPVTPANQPLEDAMRPDTARVNIRAALSDFKI